MAVLPSRAVREGPKLPQPAAPSPQTAKREKEEPEQSIKAVVEQQLDLQHQLQQRRSPKQSPKQSKLLSAPPDVEACGCCRVCRPVRF